MKYAEESADRSKVREARACMKRGDLIAAAQLLGEVIANTPDEYVHHYAEGDTLYVRFWNDEEFAHYVSWQVSHGAAPTQNIVHVPAVYPVAYFCLGIVNTYLGRCDEALRLMELGARLEPGNPKFAVQTAQILLRTRRYADALAALEPIQDTSLYVTANDLATALRGKGMALIELGEWDRAEEQFRRSLEYEPTSELAAQELEYIAYLRAGGTPLATTWTRGQQSFDPSTCSLCGESFEEGQVINLDGVMYFICEKCVGELNTK